MTDVRRNLIDKANKYLEVFPVIALLGVRQCGKTTLAKQLRPDWKYFDLEKSTDYDFITGDIDFFFNEYKNCLIIDEAQQSPQLFRELRGFIDNNRNANGRFIITGSSSPTLLHAITESLAGRIGIIEVAPMKLNELHEKPVSDFYKIVQEGVDVNSLEKLQNLEICFSYNDVMEKFLIGGYPYPVLRKDTEVYEIWMENYFKTYLQQDIRGKFPKLNDITYRRFISMLSQLSGSIINKNDLGRTLNCSEVTISHYLDIADGTYLWRSLSSYEKSVSKSIVKRPKGHLRDSGLTNFLLGIDTREKLISYPRAGNLFEAFIIEEILGGMESLVTSGWQAFYYRTKNGAEVDLVLNGKFGVLPIEIKLGVSNTKADLLSLQKFVVSNDLPFGIVINNSSEIRMLSQKIIQIPAGCL
ncbi:MAG: ATP-binding protein [Bacteroidetes bacterium]|nr:ATP-binding protein [Bacteroidota bacterium]